MSEQERRYWQHRRTKEALEGGVSEHYKAEIAGLHNKLERRKRYAEKLVLLCQKYRGQVSPLKRKLEATKAELAASRAEVERLRRALLYYADKVDNGEIDFAEAMRREAGAGEEVKND